MDTVANSNINEDVIHLQINPGEYQTFPKVDNKGIFQPIYRTFSDEEEFIKSNIDLISPTYALYKKYGQFQVLICAFSTKEEINEEAITIINQSSERVKKCLDNLLNGRMHE